MNVFNIFLKNTTMTNCTISDNIMIGFLMNQPFTELRLRAGQWNEIFNDTKVQGN